MDGWLIAALVVLAVLAVVVAGLLGFALWRARELLRPQRRPMACQPADVGLAHMEQVRIAGPRGMLGGWYLPATNGYTLICCHGIHDNCGQWLPQIARLHERGYGALVFDFAGHGMSEGNMVTFGAHEQRDVAAVVDYLRQRGDVNMDGLAIMGYSLGAITAVLSAAAMPEFRALVIESGFADLQHDIAKLFTRYTGLPSFPFAQIVVFFGQLMSGAKLSDIRPVRVIGRISPRPVLIISDLKDHLADEPYDGESLYAAAGEPKEFWQLPDVDHVAAFVDHPDEWIRRVGDFLDKYLAGQPTSAPTTASAEVVD